MFSFNFILSFLLFVMFSFIFLQVLAAKLEYVQTALQVCWRNHCSEAAFLEDLFLQNYLLCRSFTFIQAVSPRHFFPLYLFSFFFFGGLCLRNINNVSFIRLPFVSRRMKEFIEAKAGRDGRSLSDFSN